MPLPLGDLALLLFHDPLVERLEEFGQRDPEVPVELVRVVDPVARREARPNRVLPAVAFRLVLLEVDREGSRLHERPDSPHLLLDDGVDLVIRVLRLVLEPADFHEELLALPESREELHDVLGRDDPHGLVFLGHDDRGDAVLGHQLDRAIDVRVSTSARTMSDREMIPTRAFPLMTGIARNPAEIIFSAASGRGVSGVISGGFSRTVETFVAGGRFRRRISSRIVTTPTSFLRSRTGSSWMSFDFILPRTSPSVSSLLAVTRFVDMKSDTRRSWTLFRFMKNPPGRER